MGRNRIHVRLSLVIPILAAAGFSGIAPASSVAQDWTAFRGFDRQGIGNQTAAPVNWSSDEGIRWKTPIKGLGNSSPVVVGEKIFLTTAYPSEGKQFVNTAFNYFLGGMAILLALGGIRTVVRSCRAPRASASLVLQSTAISTFFAGIVMVMFLVFFGPSAIDYDRCVIRAWLGSGILVGLCVLLTEYQAPPMAWWRPLVGVLSIGYGILVILLVPSKDHAFGGGVFTAGASTVWGAAMVPFLAGVTAIFNSWIARRQVRKKSATDQPAGLPGTVRAIYLVILLGGMAVAGMVGGLIVRQRPKQGEETDWAAQAIPMDELMWWLAGATPVVLGLVCLMYSGLWNTPPGATARRSSNTLFQFAVSIGLCLIGLLAPALILSRLVAKSPFLTYHLSNPKWNPLGGWTILFVGAGLCTLFAVYELYRTRQGGTVGAIVPKGMRLLLLFVAVAAFIRSNVLSNKMMYDRGIVCLDRRGGEVLWTCEGLSGPEGQLHKMNSPATPTPVVADGRVLAFFGYSGVLCSDVDGKLLWSNPDVRFDSMYGVGVSPIVYKDTLIIVSASPHNPVIYGMNCATGQVRWKEPIFEKFNNSGNSRTPIIKTIRGKPTLLVWDFVGLSGHDPETGKQLWNHPIGDGGVGDLVASVVDDGERVYCVGSTETTALDLSILGGKDDPVVWQKKAKGANCCSPIVSHGKLYFATDGGVATCLNAKTGDVLWRDRLGGKYFASPIASGKYVYFTNDEGKTVILDATASEFGKVAECDLKSPTYASLAPLTECFLARTETHLLCIDGSRAVAKRPG